MILPRLIGETETGAQERRAQFRDQFEGLGLIAEPFAEFPVEPLFGTRPVTVMPISA